MSGRLAERRGHLPACVPCCWRLRQACLQCLIAVDPRCCLPLPRRPADRALWSEQAGAAGAPTLVFCTAGNLASVPASRLADGASWAAEVQRHADAASAGTRRASLPAVAFSSLLLACVHALARVDVLWGRLAGAAALAVGAVRWQGAVAALAGAAAFFGFKRLLDVLSEVEGAALA